MRSFRFDPTYLELASPKRGKPLALQPGLVEAHRALAGVYFQQGKFSDALEEAMRTIEMGGVQYRVATFMGATLDMIGRPDRSLKWYEVVSRLQEGPAQADPMIGDSWSRLVEDERAFHAYNRAMELQAGNRRGAIGKCHLLVLRGEFEAARGVALTHLRNSNDWPKQPGWWRRLSFFRGIMLRRRSFMVSWRKTTQRAVVLFMALSLSICPRSNQTSLGARDEASHLLQSVSKQRPPLCSVNLVIPKPPPRLAPPRLR